MSVRRLLNEFRTYLSRREEPQLRAWFDDFDWNLDERELAPSSVPGLHHLDDILDNVGHHEQHLASSLVEYAPQLTWRRAYTADDFGADFIEHVGFAELIGTRGHFASDEIAGGFSFYGQGLVYPDHYHVAEEIFIPLTQGSRWSRNSQAFEKQAAGTLIFHESNMRHSMNMQDASLLTLYLWHGGDLAQKPGF